MQPINIDTFLFRFFTNNSFLIIIKKRRAAASMGSVQGLLEVLIAKFCLITQRQAPPNNSEFGPFADLLKVKKDKKSKDKKKKKKEKKQGKTDKKKKVFIIMQSVYDYCNQPVCACNFFRSRLMMRMKILLRPLRSNIVISLFIMSMLFQRRKEKEK